MPSRPRGGGASTSQGRPYSIFRRAIEHKNLLVAEATAKEIGRQPALPGRAPHT